MTPFIPVVQAFEREGVRYVVVGGLAAIAHGVNRYTADIDFVIQLDQANAERAVRVLTSMGLKPRAPVDPMQFANTETRQTWIRDKNMMVFSFFDPGDAFLTIDLFVDYPVEFEGLFERSVVKKLGNLPVRVCSREDLVAMKRKAGRPKDLEDVRLLDRMGPNDGR
ncbi:MAG: nucleotidyl transferase AbiEii/AbiGii toxin family protein [Elusimicrobia bacterium]|nr:nucleotidyl transferase AbiEii/AbiGii toxin family protein [Elusimicrobiota bacterium]